MKKYILHRSGFLWDFFYFSIFFMASSALVEPMKPGSPPTRPALLPSSQYKYQINVDGTVAAYRLPYLLAGDSVVMKLDSGYYEHFYNELKPWTHYIPVRADLGDLLEKIQWAKEHDQEVMVFIGFIFYKEVKIASC